MSYITRNLLQNVTYWSRGAPDGFGGFAFSSPVTIKGRWEQRTDLFKDPQGNEQRSSARVYVDTDVELGGYIFLGISAATNPTAEAVGAREILDFRKTPNLRATQHERRVLL